MTHTLGPWDARPNDGQIVLNGSNCYDIKEIFNDVGGFNPADIRLMGAAPEMLAALKMCVEMETNCDGRVTCFCDDPEIARHGRCYVCTVRDAIAKAEGRE